MQKRTDLHMIDKRLLPLPEAFEYVGLGRYRAKIFFEQIGAVRKFGKRVLIDKKTLDAALDQLGKEAK